ncbi:MAG: transcriptional repressor LexA [Candidatus Marinimicrobia bacterium]|nr:transcriptional repressor LexA [Candidatus Neomarinimicrobiota bacterium]
MGVGIKTKNITKRQKEVLEVLYDCINSSGFPPSYEEAKARLGISSNQSLIDLLKKLEEKGFIKRQEGQARGIRILSPGFEILEKKPLVPFAGVSSCGAFVESYTEIFEKFEELPSSYLENEKVFESEENVFVIKVYGDSMINMGIDDGDVLLVKKVKEFFNGDVVVARDDDFGTTVKKFVATSDGRTWLEPANPNYKRIPIYAETIFDGKVILNLSKLRK